MTTFDERKATSLATMNEHDRSKKGSVDEHVKVLLEAINAREDMYTTSSCSGRILLLHEPPAALKKDHEWPLVTHDFANPDEFCARLAELSSVDGTVWLRMQTVIVHVACKDVAAAEKLLSIFVNHGWKRSGIFSLANDVMVELLSVEGMDVPVVKDGVRLVDDDFVHAFIELANQKLTTVHEKIQSAAERVRDLHDTNTSA